MKSLLVTRYSLELSRWPPDGARFAVTGSMSAVNDVASRCLDHAAYRCHYHATADRADSHSVTMMRWDGGRDGRREGATAGALSDCLT